MTLIFLSRKVESFWSLGAFTSLRLFHSHCTKYARIRVKTRILACFMHHFLIWVIVFSHFTFSLYFFHCIWMCHTAKNTVILPNFLVWKICAKAQFPHSFGRFARITHQEISWNYGILRSVAYKNILHLFFSATLSKLLRTIVDVFINCLWSI